MSQKYTPILRISLKCRAFGKNLASFYHASHKFSIKYGTILCKEGQHFVGFNRLHLAEVTTTIRKIEKIKDIP